jgi:hypothetical protein
MQCHLAGFAPEMHDVTQIALHSVSTQVHIKLTAMLNVMRTIDLTSRLVSDTLK